MELLILIVRIILMILEGAVASTAASTVAKESGVNFEKLWKLIPDKYK